MKQTEFRNSIHARYMDLFVKFLAEQGEDVAAINSHTLNLPVLAEDGTEGWLEISLKVPNEHGDEGYDKREEYEISLRDKAAKAAEKAAAKSKKELAE